MLKKRIIPCLDIKDGRTVKGIQFEGIVDAGDPIALAKRYETDGADELVFLDITATTENRRTLIELVSQIAVELAIPFTVGGGIRTVEDAKALIWAGADKVSINSAALLRPELISELASELGRQCVVVAIDAKQESNGIWQVYRGSGKIRTDWEVIAWAREAVNRGAGELLLTSMSNDGTQSGFAIEVTKAVANAVNVPVIASGGAGQVADFSTVFLQTRATGALAASIFHYDHLTIQDVKQHLQNHQIPVRR